MFENIEPRDRPPIEAGYLQQVDGENSGAPLDCQRQHLLVGSRVRERDRCAKEIHFAFLPERYEPLVEEDEAREGAKEEKKRKKREKYKKYRKVCAFAKYLYILHLPVINYSTLLVKVNDFTWCSY